MKNQSDHRQNYKTGLLVAFVMCMAFILYDYTWADTVELTVKLEEIHENISYKFHAEEGKPSSELQLPLELSKELKTTSVNLNVSRSTTLSSTTLTSQHQPHSSCQSPLRFVYLKKHKCASTTIKSVLERFEKYIGISHTLKETMYAMGGCYPGKITKACLNGQRIDSIRYHFRWNMDEIDDILELGTLRITSVRQPLDMFRSSFNYYYYEYRNRKRVS